MRSIIAVFPVSLVLILPLATLPADKPAAKALAFKVGTILPAVGEPIPNGMLVVEGGRIRAVGSAETVAVPEGAEVRNLPNAVIIPGLVDTHSHIGLYSRPHVPANGDGNESSGPVQTGLRAIDAIYHNDPGIRMALAGGVTTANIMPGSGNVIGGQTLYVKLRGNSVEAMRAVDATVLGGLKMANGENPKGYGKRGQAPFTRMKVAALQREQFIKAREYQHKWKAYRAKQGKDEKAGPPPEIDLAMETLVEVLEKKRTVHFHCHRADDLLTAVRMSEEFGFEIVLQHATEGYRVADELVRKKIPVSLTLVDSPGGKAEVMGLLEENAAILEKAGVLVAVNTDDAITESRFMLRTGSIAVRGGMSDAAALRAITINPARMMHLDHRLGSLEPGKDADFAILSGPPFSSYTQVLETYIDGVRVFDRARKSDWAYQSGGFALPGLDRLPDPPAPQNPARRTAFLEMPEKQPETLGKSYAIRAERIHVVSGPPIHNGIILIEDGRIARVGTSNEIKVPVNLPVLTVKEVTPGLIDAHSVCGLAGSLNVNADQDQDESSDPNQADLRVVDGFNPNEALLDFLRSQGVTVIHGMPGRVNVIAGQSGIFRTHGRTVDKMTLRFPASILVNLGEVPKAAYQGKGTSTRMGTAALVRNAFTQARNYVDKKRGDEDKQPPRNPKLDALEPALAGSIPVVFSAHRADDILTALRIADEFKLKPVIALGTEAYLVKDRLAEAKVPVIVHPTMQRAAMSIETMHGFTGNAFVLADAKVPIAVSTAFEGYVPKTRVLRAEATMAMSHGLGHERALRAVTLDAAMLLGIDKQYGSIEAGKVADLVLYDGDPLEHTTHVQYTLMDGKIVWSRPDYLKLPFERRVLPLLEGGAGAGCCMGSW